MSTLTAEFSAAFSRDLKKKAKRRKWDLSELQKLIDLVLQNTPESMDILKRRHNMHRLAPLTIAPVNRLILRDQELILAALSEYEEDAAYHKRNAQIFEKGYVREYPEAFAVLRPEIPNSRCEELYDILDMFGVLRASYEDLPEDEKAEVDERDISPQGFDYNDMEEGRLAGYVKHLLADKRYEELAEPLRKYSDGGNSHGPRLEMYRRMLHCFRPLWRKHMLGDRFLGLAEIEKVIAAQRYDSGY